MATATLTANLTATNGSIALPSGSNTVTLTLTGTDMASSTQQVGTSYEALAIPGDVSAPYHILIYNPSTTSTLTVSITSSDTYKFAELAPGAVCLLPKCPSAPYVKFDVADQIAWRAAEV
jgi:hypothetical protein